MRLFRLAFITLSAAGCAAATLGTGGWTPVPAGTTAEFRGLSAVSADVVWASGTRGRYARSVDGGRTWKVDSVAGAAGLDFRDIFASSATRAWAMAAGPAEQDQAQIFRTDDAVRWTRQLARRDSGVFLDALAFWDDQHGIAMSDPVGGRLFILVTDDGGATWSRVDTRNSPPVLAGEAAFAASGTCLAIQGASNVWIGTGGGARARVFRSTDRGRTWSVADTPVSAGTNASGIFSVAFDDARHGVVAGGDYTKAKGLSNNVALSEDGGATWRLAKGPLPQGYMSGVAYVPGTNGRSLVAVGLGGTARSDDRGDSWAMIDTVGYNSVAFASPNAGWAVGPRGRISRWTPAPGAGKP
jgi:photosystem II stability/assembly factor-like uncharacterized protein